MKRRDGLLPGERLIPDSYAGVHDVEKLLEIKPLRPMLEPLEPSEAVAMIESWLNPQRMSRPYERRLPSDGTQFFPDASGRAVIPDDRVGIPGRHPDQYPTQRLTPSEKPPLGLLDRILERVFALLDRWSMRV